MPIQCTHRTSVPAESASRRSAVRISRDLPSLALGVGGQSVVYDSVHHDVRRCLLSCRQVSLDQGNNGHDGKQDNSKDEVKTAPSHAFQ